MNALTIVAATAPFKLTVPSADRYEGRIVWMWRIATGTPRKWVADQVGANLETVRLWEIGDRPIPERLKGKLQDALNQSLKRSEFRLDIRHPYRRQGRIFWMARVARGLNREELAAELHISDETLRLWERGARSPDGVMIKRLAIALRQDINLFWS